MHEIRSKDGKDCLTQQRNGLKKCTAKETSSIAIKMEFLAPAGGGNHDNRPSSDLGDPAVSQSAAGTAIPELPGLRSCDNRMMHPGSETHKFLENYF